MLRNIKFKLFRISKKSPPPTIIVNNLASYLDVDVNVTIMRVVAFLMWFIFMKCMADYMNSLPPEHVHQQ